MRYNHPLILNLIFFFPEILNYQFDYFIKMEIVPEYTPIHTKLEINDFEDYMKIREIIQNYSYIEINKWKNNEYWKQSRYIFRGQGNSEWPLQPSLECILNLVESSILADVERKNNNFEQTM